MSDFVSGFFFIHDFNWIFDFLIKILSLLQKILFFLLINGFPSNCNSQSADSGFNDFWSGFFSSGALGGPSGGGGKDIYKGPSSYSTSFSSDYAGSGNFGHLNMNSPAISTSYSAYGPTENNDFSSTSYINYPPSASNTYSSSHFPLGETLQSGYAPSSISSSSGSSSSFSYTNNHSAPPATSYGVPEQATPISQHIEVTRPIAGKFTRNFMYDIVLDEVFHLIISIWFSVPVYKKFPVPVNKRVFIAYFILFHRFWVRSPDFQIIKNFFYNFSLKYPFLIQF